ncbi:MAG TPA: hypothetical protein PK509_10725 [Catalimonadaceae bacterium]|nr:hypothetical protein [Catalimonadaceae bacterium]
MTNNMDSKERLILALKRNEDQLFFDEIITLKNEGVTRSEVKQILNEITEIFADGSKEYDLILEALDIVVGWCRPELKIWPDE